MPVPLQPVARSKPNSRPPCAVPATLPTVWQVGGVPCDGAQGFDVHLQQDASAHGRITGKAQLCGGFVYLTSRPNVKVFWKTRPAGLRGCVPMRAT